jgi:hypothetical protein
MNSGTTNFKDDENKGLLWNLLVEHGSFNGILNNKMVDVKKIFEDNINELSSNTGDLISLNKEFFQRMLKILPMYKETTRKSGGAIEEVYTAEKLQNSRIDSFNTKLSTVQNEFDSLIKLKTPEGIDFSDKSGEFNTNIDQDLAQAIASRQLDMEQMASTQQTHKQEGADWINASNPDAIVADSTTDNSDKLSKRVTFNDNDGLDDLFVNLKQHTPPLETSEDNKSVVSLLERIAANQREMINIMNSLKKIE